MKEKEIKKLKKGEIFNCSECGKELKYSIDEIHFLGDPSFDFGEGLQHLGDDELKPMCEECHNKIFGKDLT